MTTDIVQATDAMNAAVKTAWDAAIVAQSITASKIFYPGIVKGGALEVGGPSDYWARVGFLPVGQGSNGPGASKHGAFGLVTVQMFFPLSVKGSWRKGLAIGTTVKNALARSTGSGTVWFRNPRLNVLDHDAKHHRLNVVAEYEYDETV